jgi:hypothetical protein
MERGPASWVSSSRGKEYVHGSKAFWGTEFLVMGEDGKQRGAH